MGDGVAFLVDRAVEQIWVWGPFRLVFDGNEPETAVLVEGPACLATGGSTVDLDFHADGNVAESTALLQLLWQRVTSARIEDAILCLSFGNGFELRVHPSAEAESWHVSGRGQTITCLAGGELIRH
jgi:hypothetical protein